MKIKTTLGFALAIGATLAHSAFVSFAPHITPTVMFMALWGWVACIVIAVHLLVSASKEHDNTSKPGTRATLGDPMLERILTRFSPTWRREMKVRDALLFGLDAPLADIQAEYERETKPARDVYEAACHLADMEQDAHFAEARNEAVRKTTEADRELHVAQREADELLSRRYREADSKLERDLRSAGENLRLRSQADDDHLRARAAADDDHLRARAAADDRHLRQKAKIDDEFLAQQTRTDGAQLDARDKAKRRFDKTTQAAAAKLENAVREYVAAHPDEVKRIAGDEGETYDSLITEGRLSVMTVQTLPLPELISAAIEIVDGRRKATQSEMAFLATNIRNCLATDDENDPHRQLHGKARELLLQLIRRLN